ncbi:hypothetical protein [Salmonella enterica]
MPHDRVYTAKRTPVTLRTAWSTFYSDAPAMVALACCAGLVAL